MRSRWARNYANRYARSKKSSKAAEGEEFHGKRVLLTCGTRGIGAAIVHRLTAGGGRVITTGRWTPSGDYARRLCAGRVSAAGGIDKVVRAITERIGESTS